MKIGINKDFIVENKTQRQNKRDKMKTLGYTDNCDGDKVLKVFYRQEERNLFQQKRHERIQEALFELKHVGNITVYLIRGKKYRKLFKNTINYRRR